MLNHPWLENILSRHSHQPAGALESLCYNQRFSHTRIDSRGQTRLKSVRILSLGLLLLMTACGGSPPSNAPVVSKLKNRVFLANFQSNVIQIIDAQNDTLSTFTISVSSPAKLLVSSDKSTTMSYDSLARQVTAISNSTESAVGSGVALPDATDSLAISPNGQTGYAAFPTQVCSGSTVVGGVGIIDLV